MLKISETQLGMLVVFVVVVVVVVFVLFSSSQEKKMYPNKILQHRSTFEGNFVS